MVLDIKFIIAGTIIILCLVPLYIYRKHIFKAFYKKGDIKSFLKEVSIILRNDYPKIPFDFNILSKYKDEKDIRVLETLIVEDFTRQFAYQEYEMSTQGTLSKEHLWSTYDQNSVLKKDNKYPNDWNQRKEAAWHRDHGKCNRCGIQLKLNEAQTLFAKQMKNGGGFNLENIVILCNDCSKIIKSPNIEKTARDLHILEKLMRKVEG